MTFQTKRMSSMYCMALMLCSFVMPCAISAAEQLKVHGIFRSNMVLQRDKPIVIWGWAPMGAAVTVAFGSTSKSATAAGDEGRWEVTFDSQPANIQPQNLTVTAGEKTVTMNNIVIGDVWVMNGQSNMAFALKAVYDAEFEAVQAHLPLLRSFRINSGAESEFEEKDINEKFINGDEEDKNWRVVTPDVALSMGAIGYVFGSRLQRGLQIPIGIIDNARGGASIESLVPRHKFADDPDAKAYLAWVDERNKAFDQEAFLKQQMEKYEAAEEKYQQAIAKDKEKGVQVKRKRPQKPDGSIRTWSVPGRSPSDAAACYNGMFGVFKGFNIKGVAFHQGFNNSMMNTSCKPKFYRTLMRLMVEGWREDFNDPNLPVAVIGLCAGGDAQTHLNFEEKGLSSGAYIRESQRLGLADAGHTEFSTFIPAYDQKIPQLHTKKKGELGLRVARWAFKEVYKIEGIDWDIAHVKGTEVQDNKIVVTFDTAVRPDDFSPVIEGFSIADESGVFYMAEAAFVETKDKAEQFRRIVVSSPLVSKPVAIRYAWSRAPLGNLKVNGLPWQPLYSFRTDNFDFTAEVSHMDPEGNTKNAAIIKEMKATALAALKKRLEASGLPTDNIK